MSSSSSENASAPCAGCKHLRRRCVPGCVFTPYFSSSPDDGARFAAVHGVFGASNVPKLLAELAPEERAEAVESLPPPENVLGHVRGQVAAARVELARLVGPEEAFRPFDPTEAPEARGRHGEKQPNYQKMVQAQTARERQALMMTQHSGMVFPDEHVQGQPHQIIEPQTAAADQVGKEQDIIMLQQIGASKQQPILHQQVTDAAEAAKQQQDMMMGIDRPRQNQEMALKMAGA
ncbi:hypothetical protein PR202_gb12303 [Eleusine coracana subsp. coracana]|uniref:LOB domain-containing protein n=1 Tax=Eleusine coracana subsp. coracana TaxID=191504 RepID=A0AAV5ER23_ELECO|nr:hypothetical protein PR202_gb12303 [Eleusine coracana subsp. coracana]